MGDRYMTSSDSADTQRPGNANEAEADALVKEDEPPKDRDMGDTEAALGFDPYDKERWRSENVTGRASRIFGETLRGRIKAAIRAGCTQEVACQAAGVSTTAFQLWMQKARLPGDDFAMYRAFAAEMSRARGEGEAVLAARVFKASEHDWKAAARILAVRHPDRWANVERRMHSSAGGGPVRIEIVGPELAKVAPDEDR